MAPRTAAVAEVKNRRVSIEKLSAVCTIAATLIAVATYLFTRGDDRAIDIRIVTSDSLLSPTSATLPQPIEVFFSGARVVSPRRFVCELVCTGRSPVRREDVEVPVSLQFAGGRVLSASIPNVHPEGIEASAVVHDASVEIRHGLLNPGDIVRIEALLDSSVAVPTVSARIADVKRVRIIASGSAAPGLSPFAFAMPVWIEWFFTIVGSMVMLGLIAALIRQMIKEMSPKLERVEGLAFELIDPSKVLIGVAAQVEDISIAEAIREIGSAAKLDHLDQDAFAEAMARLDSVKCLAGSTASLLVESAKGEVSQYLPAVIDASISQNEKLQKDSKLTNAIAELKEQFPHELSWRHYVVRVFGLLKPALVRAGYGKPPVAEQIGVCLAFGCFMLIMVPFALFMVAAWKYLLSM